MKDKMTELYEMLIKNDVVKKHTYDDKEERFRINFYVEPETADLNKPFIIIEPLGPPEDTVYGSDRGLSTQFIYQIDCQSKNRLTCKELQQAIKEELMKIDFYQLSGGFDEYFRETGRFIDARKYQGNTKLYDTNY